MTTEAAATTMTEANVTTTETTTETKATMTKAMSISDLSPEVLLQAYDAHIAEARSDLAQLKSVRLTLQLKHDVKVKERQQYLNHLSRKIKIRITNGGDYTRYAHAMEECYKTSGDERPVNDVLRRQAMLLSITHKCEVSRNVVEMGIRQNKALQQSLQKEVAGLKEETATMLSVYAKKKEDKLKNFDKTKQYYLEMKILPQRMVINRLENLSTDMMDLQEEMMRRRQRQNKSFQQTLKEKAENFRQLRRDSFQKARERRNSMGSQKSNDLADVTSGAVLLAGDDDRSLASNKSAWSFRSGRSAKSGRSAFSGVEGAKSFIGALFGRQSTTTLESEMSPVPLQINVKNTTTTTTTSTSSKGTQKRMNQWFDKGEMAMQSSDKDLLDDDDSVDTDPMSSESIPTEVTINVEDPTTNLQSQVAIC